MITLPGVVLLLGWVGSLGVVAIVVHCCTRDRAHRAGYRAGEQRGFLDGRRSERRYHAD